MQCNYAVQSFRSSKMVKSYFCFDVSKWILNFFGKMMMDARDANSHLLFWAKCSGLVLTEVWAVISGICRSAPIGQFLVCAGRSLEKSTVVSNGKPKVSWRVYRTCLLIFETDVPTHIPSSHATWSFELENIHANWAKIVFNDICFTGAMLDANCRSYEEMRVTTENVTAFKLKGADGGSRQFILVWWVDVDPFFPRFNLQPFVLLVFYERSM